MCRYQGTSMGNVTRHSNTVHQKKENTTCTKCNKFVQKDNMPRHLISVHSEVEQTKYSCDLCTFESNYKGNLLKHINDIHQKQKPR